ncbi:polysaccharide pyruvyl transferase family protein [Virgibacillus sp. 179-BFC.A HS]|uniref:Polysaccharide pyruvyl transferase family protein n=1 Tax=Tigheibacillus jepli TaxID=3035914 RepID=A0ABU5CEK3_9BACI|nr:polysaccharide pyruvyl transferase family protein [Virgibacillus sp. 179-BFC.A HS]MDY0404716.1 polysaccharide pyruvyl transferase family protein [Virgibacillus sp. 179-BFC.A HS]
MKIGVVGNYGNNNQGDEAILEGILVQLQNAYQLKREDILVFSNNPAQTHEKYGVKTVNLFQRRKTDPMKLIATLMHHRPIIRKLDVLLIGGGGILMDLYRNNPIVYGMYAWMAKRTKTPYVVYGVGVGPLTTMFGKKIIRSIANGANVVTVRDPKSKELLRTIGVNKPIHVISDPAFFVPLPEKPVKEHDGFHIGVTAVPYYNKRYWPKEDKQKYKDYIDGMATNLDNLLDANQSATVNFFLPSTRMILR